MISILIVSLVSIIYSTAIFGLSLDTDTHSLTLESHNREHERARQRQLIYDTGNNRQCFDVNYNRGYEDYFNNPFLANHNRGDWGKCMPELLFSALCIHEDIEKLNDGSWQVSDGPLHEAPSEKMFLALKSLHSSQCLHIDIEFSTLLKEKLNDYFFARNEFAISTTNYTSNTYSFVVTVANGKFFVNGKSSPVLTLTKGSTYSFFMGVNAYAMNPFLIGTSVGTPYAPVYLTDEYDMKKVKFTIPFNAPRTLVYYSSNATAVGNNIISQDPVQLNIVPRGGVFYINDQPQPTLTLTVGVTYTFVVKNSDQQLFPFAFGTATNAPYLTSSAITVTEGSYATRFTVLFRDSSVTSLVYYCLNNPFMTGGINIVSGSRRQLASNEDVQGTSTCNGNYLNPRAAIRKSLYCLFSNLAQSLPTALTQKPYAVSNTCDQIARSYLTSSIYYPPVWPPLQYCDQAPIPAVDSCTVIANVNFWTSQGRTCKDYCEAFPGLTCAAAAAPEWHYIKPHWQPQCMARRQWSCTTPQTAETYLLCTCASKAQLSGSITPPINTNAPTVSPSSTFTASPSLAKSSPTAATSRSSAAPTRTVRPSVSPSSAPIKTACPSAAPSSAPTTTRPSAAPSSAPTTTRPSAAPSRAPTNTRPSAAPSRAPTTTRPSVKAPTTTARPSVKPTRTPTVKPVLVKRVFLHEVEENLQTQEQKNVQVVVGVPTIVPSPASVVVPTQFNFLRGKCITARDQGFSYPTCFFKNVTQTNWWFTANIGYFGKQINANSFAIYGGDLCGSTNRGGKVILSCGATVSSVTVESPMCYYTLNFTSPQFCISPSYYSAPSASPVTLNPPGQYITPACLALLSGDVYQPNTFCSQDTLMDTCTTVVNNWVGGAQNGSCSQYCGRHGLQCVSAYRNWGCMAYQRLSCSDVTTDYTMSCQCGQPISNAVVVANPNLNTQSCQQIMFNNWANLKPDKFCPRNLIVSTSQDSCTVWRNSNNQVSCDTFCSNYPGLKCLSAAVGDPSTCAVHANYYGAPPLSCSAIPPQYNALLCTCGVDSSSMPAVVAAANAPMSNACINIMTQPEPFASFDRLCRSDPIANTCQVSVHTNTYLTPLTCSQYCAQYSGMRCVDAQFANGDLQRCTVNQNSQFPKPSCDLNMMDHTSLALCTCGFAPSAPQQNKFMLSHFDPNRPYCPAYPANVDSYNISSLPTSRRRLDDWSDVYGYERYYKKIVVGVDYNTAKADGSVKVTNVKTSWDRSDWRIDSYNTNTPEMCTGLESRIRPGDPPGKCSFGNRPNNSAASDCLGKLYSMNYKEASNKCKARGGRLAQVDTPQKLRDLYDLYVHDGELSIGLKDVGGQNWQWDGPSNIQVPATWLNSTIPYKPYLGTHWAYSDCIIIRFNRQSQTYAPYFTTASCDDKRTYICQGISNPATPGIGGDLLADEGGFCLWYYGNPTISLPDDQSANFRNTELAHFLLTSPIQSTSKYELLYNKLYSYHIPGHPENLANWKSLTRKQVGQNSDLPVFPPNSFNHSFHCHFSPTNFGIARIYGQQHMLERLYSGAAHLHCFCGFKNLGKLVDRCDCTRSGETNNNCLTEHRKILYEETYRQTGEYVSCNNCNNPSP